MRQPDARRLHDRSWRAVGEAGLTSLANPELGLLGRAADGLNAAKCLHDVVEEAAGRVVDLLALPVREGVAQAAAAEVSTRSKKSISRDRGARRLPAATYRMSTSLIRASAVPSWYLFQLSAVPTLTPGKDDFMSLILARSCSPVKFPR